MKPEQLNGELSALVAIAPENRLGNSATSPELQQARNELGARVQALIERLGPLCEPVMIDGDQRSPMDSLELTEEYDGPAVHLLSPELQIFEDISDQATDPTVFAESEATAERKVGFIRGAVFFLPIPEETVRQVLGDDNAAVLPGLYRQVMIGYERKELYETVGGVERLKIPHNYEVEAVTSLGSDTDKLAEDYPVVDIVEDFVIIENTGDPVDMFGNPTELEGENAKYLDEYRYPLNGAEMDEAQALCDRRLATKWGLDILDSFDVASLEAAVEEIERRAVEAGLIAT